MTEEVRVRRGFREREWHRLETWGTHYLLRESSVRRDRNTEQVRAAQRDAEYAYRLAIDRGWSIEFAVTCDAQAQYLPRHARVLDLGGGPGRYTIRLAQRGHRVRLVDLSITCDAGARQAAIRAAGIDAQIEPIIETDARNLGAWADNSFDAVVCLGPFHHVPEADDRDRVARELLRVLAGKGVAFLALIPALAFVRRSLPLPEGRRHLGLSSTDCTMGSSSTMPLGDSREGYGVKIEDVGRFFSLALALSNWPCCRPKA